MNRSDLFSSNQMKMPSKNKVTVKDVLKRREVDTRKAHQQPTQSCDDINKHLWKNFSVNQNVINWLSEVLSLKDISKLSSHPCRFPHSLCHLFHVSQQSVSMSVSICMRNPLNVINLCMKVLQVIQRTFKCIRIFDTKSSVQRHQARRKSFELSE